VDDEQAEADEQAEKEGTNEETNKEELAGKDQEKKGGKKNNKKEAADCSVLYLPSSYVVAVYGVGFPMEFREIETKKFRYYV
jgi:hypothetical protein